MAGTASDCGMFFAPQTLEKVLKELHIQLWHKGFFPLEKGSFSTKREDTCLITLAVNQQEKLQGCVLSCCWGLGAPQHGQPRRLCWELTAEFLSAARL